MEAAESQRFNRWSVMSNHEINRYDAIPPHIIKALTLCAARPVPTAIKQEWPL